MAWQVENLQISELHSFWTTFKKVLETQFPGYSKKVVRYFLEQIYSERAFALYLQTNQKIILIVREKDEIVGFAVIDSPYGGVSLCRWLGVHCNFQHKGIGTALVKYWLDLAAKQGCHKAEVAAQSIAKTFYEKAGLTLEGKREKSYFGIDQYIFGKVLGPVRDESLTRG